MTKESESLLRFVRHNARLKLFAFTLALACWYLVREETSDHETIHGITIELTAPDGWTVRSQSAERVSVTFRGSRADLRDLTSEDVRVEADLRKVKAAEAVVVRLTGKNVRAPAGVRASQREPEGDHAGLREGDSCARSRPA